MAVVPDRQVAFVFGRPPAQTIAVASLADGRMVRRLERVRGVGIQGLASSADGKTLYYVADGTVWAIPASDGEPRKIRAGDGVVVDAGRQELLIKLHEKQGIRLVRVPIARGAERAISLPGDLRLTRAPFSPNAVGKDGRIALQGSTRDSWFWRPALLDPETGKLERIPIAYEADFDFPGWTSDGRIVRFALPIRSTLWRFRENHDRVRDRVVTPIYSESSSPAQQVVIPRATSCHPQRNKLSSRAQR